MPTRADATNMKDENESQIVEVVANLIDAAADKVESVREAVGMSLKKLAKKCPNDVLQCVMNYKKRNQKLTNTHLISLLTLMEHVCQEHINSIELEMVHQLVTFSIEEMTHSVDYIPDTQLRASGVLVALGNKFCIEVMDGLVLKLQPGVLPHWAVLYTLADLAAANPFGIVPFVKATLGTLLPMLGAARSDFMRQGFAFALGRLSEAVLEYIAGLSSAPDPTVRSEAFAAEVGAAYDVLAASWLGSRDPRVLSPVLDALGPMLALQGGERVREQAPRLVSTLLALYKRCNDPIPITKCLAAVLQTVHETTPGTLEPLLDILIPSLFDQICPSPDYAQPQTVKNHFEALRCFDHLARSHAGRLTEAILQLLRNNNERERIRALLVTAHLAGSGERLLGSHTVDVVAGLQAMPAESGYKAKKALLKAAAALACRGHLVGAACVHFVHFLVNNCSENSGKVTDDKGEDFGYTCANTLFLLASTVPAVENSLWPVLLQCLLEPKYTGAAGDIARCLAHLAAHRAELGPHELPSHVTEKPAVMGEEAFEHPAPSPAAIFARCLALLGAPMEGNRGSALLAFLRRYCASLSRLLPPLWEQRIPELAHHLETLGSDDDLEHRDNLWEDLLLDFVAATLTEIDQCAWALSLGNAILQQMCIVPPLPLAERASLYKCLALAASHASDANLLKRSLDVLLGNARLHSAIETQAVGRAIGLLSRRHLSPVLARLETMRKEEAAMRRSSGRLLGIGWRGSGSGETGADRVRLTLAACYGQVAVEAPADDLLPALEAGPLSWLIQTLISAKDIHLKQVVLQALGNVADGLHPNRCNSSMDLTLRADVLAQVLSQLQSRDASLMATALQVATAFLKLPPVLSSEDRIVVLRVSFEEVFGSLVSHGKDHIIDKNETELCTGDPATSCLLSSLGALTHALLLASTTPAALDDVFSLLEPWLVTSSHTQRAAALSILNGALQYYTTNMKFGCETPSRFGQTGLMLGRIVPRCTDPSMEVRRLAVGTVRLILGLAARYEGRLGADNNLVSALANVQHAIQTSEPTQLLQATEDLAKALCQTLPPLQLVPFVDSLLDGLADSTDSGSAGASVVLTVVLKTKGGELYHQVSPILGTIVSRANSATRSSQNQIGAAMAVLALARHHLKAVVASLLLQPLPFDQAVQECWRALARDNTLAGDVLDQLLHLIQSTPLYEERSGCGPPVGVLIPLAAVAALRPLLLEPALQQLALQRFPELFATLLTAAACYVGVAPPVHMPNSNGLDTHGVVPNRSAYRLCPDWVARESLRALLLSVRCDNVAEVLSQNCHPEAPGTLETFVELVPHIARSMSQVASNLLPKVITSLNHYSSSTFEPQRAAVISFLSELIFVHAGGHLLLLEGILSSLLNCLSDPSALVRRLCLRGLGATAGLPPDQRVRHAEQVLSALVHGLDEPAPLEAVRGLVKVLPVTDNPALLRGVTVTIALRIRPFFEREDAIERAAALQLFGELARAGIRIDHDKEEPGANTALIEQIQGALVPLLLHLHDSDDNVIRASKYALRQSAPLLGAPRTNAMIQGHLIDTGSLHYEEFAIDLIRTLTRELPDQVPQFVSVALSYTRGGCPELRGDAVLLVGLLCGSLTHGIGSTDAACTRLVQLLKDDNMVVRAKAAQALSCLYIS